MSELRERKKPASQPVPAHPSPHDAGLGKSEAPKKAVPIARSRPAPPRRKAPSILNAFFGLAVVGLVVLVAQSKLSAFGSRHPARYGICTFDDSVYLDAYTRTECVVIGADGAIESTGTRTETREKYGDLDTLGKLGRWNVNLPSSQAGKGLKIYNVPRGQAVYPGLTDAHGHIMQYGRSLTQVSLHGATSIPEVVQRIKNFIDRLPAEKRKDYNRVIEVQGFDQTKYPGKQFPTAADLDVPELKGRKIFLLRVDIHACWVSPALLETLEIPESIAGGVILRDAAGKPTGVFLDTAYEHVMAQLAEPSLRDKVGFLEQASKKLLAQGITSVHDAATGLDTIEIFRKLDTRNALPLRVYAMVACPVLDIYCGDQVERYEGSRLTVRAVKLFLDGALGSWGAAMLEAYSDNPQEKGITRVDTSKMYELARAWTDKGFQVNTHAIGDAANRIAVDVYERLLREERQTDNQEKRYRIEHAQILSQEDIAIAGKLGLIASVQPTHCTSDMGYAESRLGPKRVLGAYAWQTLRKAGCPLALGSDFPVEDINPFEGLHAAITRLDRTNSSPHGPGGWYPSEALSREAALEGFTSGAAWAGFLEHKVGKLTKGMRADIVVLDRDILRIDDRTKIRETRVLATVLDGRVVHGRL